MKKANKANSRSSCGSSIVLQLKLYFASRAEFICLFALLLLPMLQYAVVPTILCFVLSFIKHRKKL